MNFQQALMSEENALYYIKYTDGTESYWYIQDITKIVLWKKTFSLEMSKAAE